MTLVLVESPQGIVSDVPRKTGRRLYFPRVLCFLLLFTRGTAYMADSV